MGEQEIAARVELRRHVLLWFKELRVRSGIDPSYEVNVEGKEIKLCDLEHSASSIPMSDFMRIVVELGATPSEILQKNFELNKVLDLMGFKPLKPTQKIEPAQVLPLRFGSTDSQSSETVS